MIMIIMIRHTHTLHTHQTTSTWMFSETTRRTCLRSKNACIPACVPDRVHLSRPRDPGLRCPWPWFVCLQCPRQTLVWPPGLPTLTLVWPWFDPLVWQTRPLVCRSMGVTQTGQLPGLDHNCIMNVTTQSPVQNELHKWNSNWQYYMYATRLPIAVVPIATAGPTMKVRWIMVSPWTG